MGSLSLNTQKVPFDLYVKLIKKKKQLRNTMQDFVHFKGKEITLWGFPDGSAVKNLPVNAGDAVRPRFDP